MDNTTRQLLDYACDASYGDLPESTVAHCKYRLLDSLGCVAAAYDHPLSIAARTLAGNYSFNAPATILGTRQRVAPEMAAFANGVMIRVLDLSDMYRVKSGGHPSDVIAALLAAAEVAQCDGKSLIAAIATAYEIYCGCCQAIDLNSIGWDQPVYGIVAATLASGKLMNLTRNELGHALSLALVPNMALYQTRHGELSNWKGCAAANGSRNALFAVMLAKSGFTGPAAAFEGEGGLWSVVGRFEWPIKRAQYGHLIGETHLKTFPICYHGQSAAWVAMDMQPSIQIESIESVQIDTYRSAHKIMANHPSRWAPQSAETADHSLPYVVAVALSDGALDQRSFEPARLRDPVLAALMAKTQVCEDPQFTALYPEASPCRITVRLRDGPEIRREMRYPKGHARNPLSDQEVEHKFKNLFGAYSTEQHSDRIIEKITKLEHLADVQQLIDAFARPKPALDREVEYALQKSVEMGLSGFGRSRA